MGGKILHNAAMRKPGKFYPILLLVCWTGFIVVGNYAVFNTPIRQFRALHFATTQGEILQSEMGHGVVSRRGVAIAYNYTVDGQTYTGRRYRYNDGSATSQWERTINAFPRWAKRRVYYNPRNPADAILVPGIDGSDLLLLLFALPLDIATWGFWRAALSRHRGSCVNSPAGVPIVRQAGETRAQLAEGSPLSAAFYGMAGTAFVAAFPVVGLNGFEPSLRWMVAVWIMVLAAGPCAFLWRMARNRSGLYDLRVNDISRVVTIPQTAGRKRPLALSRQEISGISIQRRSNRSPNGTFFSYLPALNCTWPGQISQPVKLTTWGWSEPKARAFTEWLSRELNVEFRGVEEETPSH